jgi:hypothetical protein
MLELVSRVGMQANVLHGEELVVLLHVGILQEILVQRKKKALINLSPKANIMSVSFSVIMYYVAGV